MQIWQTQYDYPASVNQKHGKTHFQPDLHRSPFWRPPFSPELKQNPNDDIDPQLLLWQHYVARRNMSKQKSF